MMCARGRISHSTRIAIRIASWAARIMKRVRRSRRSQSRYCGLAVRAGASSFGALSLDMDLELLPEGVEVAVELRRIPRRKWRRAPSVAAREANGVLGFHTAGTPRQHNDPLRHADRLADVVRHEDRR